MIDDALVLRVERLRDSVEAFRDDLKARYSTKTRPVTTQSVRDAAAQLGERWLVEVAGRDDVLQVVGADVVADLNIEFQRLITYSEQMTQRSRYDATLSAISSDFRTRVIVPLKQARFKAVVPADQHRAVAKPHAPRSVFIGESFATVDATVNSAVHRITEAFGFTVVTGEKPRADSVSKKVRDRIESADVFIGIFTRRERIRGRNEWTTSSWVIDEKAYALASRKKLILLRESGVQSIGGIQGDYEYIEFTRTDTVELLVKLVQTLRSLSVVD